MYRMAMLAMLLDDSELDLARCIRMALVHDLGEAIVGDITPYCGIPNDKKHRLEDEVACLGFKCVAEYNLKFFYTIAFLKFYRSHIL